jgi:hypothetical protein
MNEQSATEIFSEKLFAKKDKIVTIWGAGTSIKSGIPGGYYIMEKMINDLTQIINTSFCREQIEEKLSRTKKFSQSSHERVEEECTKIIKRIKYKQNIYFEYVMWVYSLIYNNETLYNWLKDFIKPISSEPNPPYFPSFSHEYCSHLANSGYLKYFISVNFDEILETTLENELGFENFKIIASKSEFESLNGKPIHDWVKFYGLNKHNCFVFKPHGTISRGLTLRCSPENVSHFEVEKRKTLIEVLRDAVIVFLGFGNYNENFWLLFGETYSMGLTKDIFIVDVESESIRKKFPDERINNRIYEYNGKIDDFFKEVFIYHKKLPDKQKPTRHVIRSQFFDLFSRKLTKLKKESLHKEKIEKLKIFNKWWYDLRIYEIELLVYLFKSRGLFVNMAAADCTRVKKAYMKCLKWKESIKDKECELSNYNLEPSDVLSNILNGMFGIGDVFDRFNSKVINVYSCFLLISKNIKDNNQDNLFEQTCSEVSSKYVEYLKGKVKSACKYYREINGNIEEFNIFESKSNVDNEEEFEKFLKENLKELITDFDINIVDDDISTSMRFIKPKQILNRNEFNNITETLFEKGKELKITTISAEWLTKKISGENKLKDFKHIQIISNFEVFAETGSKKKTYNPKELFHYRQMVGNIVKLISEILKSDFTNNIEIDWYVMKHLQDHMTIVINKDMGENGKALYFRRAGKNAEISPVLLSDNNDVKTLTKYFDDCVKSLKVKNKEGCKLFNISKKNKGIVILTLCSKYNSLKTAEFKQLKEIINQTKIEGIEKKFIGNKNQFVFKL